MMSMAMHRMQMMISVREDERKEQEVMVGEAPVLEARGVVIIVIVDSSNSSSMRERSMAMVGGTLCGGLGVPLSSESHMRGFRAALNLLPFSSKNSNIQQQRQQWQEEEEAAVQ
jgi:hypothetical protein